MADSSDIEVLSALANMAISELSTHRGGDVWSRREARARPVDQSLSEAILDDEQLVAMGTIDTVPVGYAAAHVSHLHDNRALAVLDDVYVLPDARGVGVGESMLEICLEWARGKNCIGLDALALPGDRGTKNFFESFGLVARALVVHRRLATDDGS